MQVENLVVGAPCGVMDQMAATVGRSSSLMALTCQPAQVSALQGANHFCTRTCSALCRVRTKRCCVSRNFKLFGLSSVTQQPRVVSAWSAAL